jgi:hypothetical protein
MIPDHNHSLIDFGVVTPISLLSEIETMLDMGRCVF